MKVLIIGPAHPLRGGIADSTEALCRSFIESGHRAEIISYSLQYPGFLFPGKTQYTKDPKPSDIEIHKLINSVNPISWHVTASFINRYDPDLIIVRFWIPFMGMCLGSILRMVSGPARIVALCDNIIPHESRPGDSLLTKYFVKGCHAFVTFSKQVREEVAQFTEKPSRFHPLPMDTRFPPKIDRQLARQKLGLNPDTKYLLFFGLVRGYKGLDLLLKAIAEEILEPHNFKLLVVGEFYSDKKTYLSLISNLGISHRVIIRDEFIPTSEISDYFSAVDLLSQTYKTASQSGITQMAYYYDLPMLVTDVGGLAEIVPHEKVGYVVQKNPAAIANAIGEFLERDRFNEFSSNVKKEKKKFSWTLFTDNMIELYHTLL